VGVLVTVWILWGPLLVFAYHGPRAHLVLDTVDACVALLAAYLAHGRFVRARHPQDLLLAQSLVVLALSGSVAGTLAVLLPGEPGTTDVWLPMTLRTAGAVLLLGAALVGPGRTAPAGARRWTVLGPVLLLGATSVGFWLLDGALPVAVDTAYLEAEVRPALLTAHPVLIAVQLAAAACFLVASVAWARGARRTGDELMRWLGPACALGGFARVNYALAPSLYTDWLYTGDLLRTGFYLLLLVGAARELAQYWTARTVGAVLEDRRRLARELHDGVVQELTYIRGETHRIGDDPALRERILGATDRGLDEARAAIHALSRVDEESLATMLRRTGRELGRRHGLEVHVEADDTVEVDPDRLHTLLRIVRESVTNAARHGRARTVHVELVQDGEGRVLRVRDDGAGFDVAEAGRHGTGYGLVSMGERARSLPGTLRVDSTIGTGSEVVVQW
jgi:signal transduction histidine kinase